MNDFSKHKKPDKAKMIDDLMQSWVEPKNVAAAVGIAPNSAWRYIYALGYRRCYITMEEAQMLQTYRASKRVGTKP